MHSDLRMNNKGTNSKDAENNLPFQTFHIGARCINREWFKIPMPEVWEIMGDYLHFIHRAYRVRPHAAVLMGNHLHLLATFEEGTRAEAMNYFMRETSRVISRSAGRINQTWGRPYHWSWLRTELYFLNCYRYILRNPVRAGLARTCEEYPYSTLRGLLGFERLTIPTFDDTLMNDVEGTLKWFTQPEPKELIEYTRLGLRRREFSMSIPERKGRQKILRLGHLKILEQNERRGERTDGTQISLLESLKDHEPLTLSFSKTTRGGNASA